MAGDRTEQARREAALRDAAPARQGWLVQPSPKRGPAQGGDAHRPSSVSHGRVHLAIGALTPQTRRTIDTAVRLALEAGDGIDCVFVEEIDLFRAAELPVTREMGVLSRSPRRFDTPDLVQALRRQAQEAQRALAQAALRSRLQWSFEVVRGALLREALRRAGEQDLIVIGLAGCDVDGMIERAIEREALAAMAEEPGWSLRRRSTTLVAYPHRPAG
ncbi:MAG TPA: hypothetical protein VN324_15485 [Quisquiliibacterium sp.]|nr:hypothetical protein [Quisquiliibacterium sp.]